ncbi:homeodomain-interacting protein kinase 2-like isoform X2 [Ananas comosus]|uniref:Homeodomain-interacting protein kinase 2-like isoform X2 n=1 Tax=Ananas comosus TaxID=4615 RepID=A0A6P5FMT4_ANACO|nr:homeodomain-interacting protein kinase 2-like isoform X2 [Ananas comosus]
MEESGSSKEDDPPPWRPPGGAFRPYNASESSSAVDAPAKSGTGKTPFVERLTKGILETFQMCNPNFKHLEVLNPKHFFTNPSDGIQNNGHDNANSDLILYTDCVLVNLESKRRYVVKDMLGQGTFGQVAKCWNMETKNYVAVKVIKNHPAYYRQGLIEVAIVDMLNQKFDPDDQYHIVRILDHFVHQNHLCITFELLGSNLFELIKPKHPRGLSLNNIQMFSQQILQALVVMKDAGIIHCDLKPENILVSSSVQPLIIKVIDFGSACLEGKTCYTYIQSRHYRSPEVLLGHQYNAAIDMWSFGCIIAELFLGVPLFPAVSEYDLLKRMIETLGAQPPDSLLRDAKKTNQFFKHVGSTYCMESEGVTTAFRVLTEEEYEERESKRPAIGKLKFKYVKLEDLIANYPYSKNMSKEEIRKESFSRVALVDFLRGLLELDPERRWSPLQALHHPFITGELLTCPYEPPSETRRKPIFDAVTVDHNPGWGHWLANGLSPQVVAMNKSIPQNSPHLSKVPLSYGSSYSSLGSYGSCIDNTGLRSSYNGMNSGPIYSSPLGPRGPLKRAQAGGYFPGPIPDARRMPWMLNPGSLGQMSLGASPLQFSPPSSQMHVSTVSQGSYGPTSPRGFQGSYLRKSAVVGQYNVTKNWGSPTMSMHNEIMSDCGPGHCDNGFQGHVGSPYSVHSTSTHFSRRQPEGGDSSLSSGASTSYRSFPEDSHDENAPHTLDVSYDKLEGSSSAPGPADWDPNYSDDYLLQEDNSEVNSLCFSFSNDMQLGNHTGTTITTPGAGRADYGQQQPYTNSNLTSLNQRAENLLQAYSFGGSNLCTAHSQYFQPILPDRFGQQSVQWFGLVDSASMHGHQIGQQAWPNHNMAYSDFFHQSYGAEQWHVLGRNCWTFHSNDVTPNPW